MSEAFVAYVADVVAPAVLEFVGWVMVADTVDTMAGSPVKKELGLVATPGVSFSMGGPSYSRIAAKDKAEGFRNYLKTLTDVAPGFVARERPRLRESYDKAIKLREKSLREDESFFEIKVEENLP